MTEIEVKIRIADADATRAWLRNSGWQPEPVANEVNWVFDRTDGSLRTTNRLLRVRQVNERAWLTVKLPVDGVQGAHKVREELEVTVSDGHTLVRALEALDYAISWRYDKRRTAYHHADAPGEILLDEVPIGTYIELEGPPAWIDATAAALGYSPSDYLTMTYRDIWTDYLAEHPDAGRDMIFPDSD